MTTTTKSNDTKGIKETLEVLEGVKAVAVPAKTALKDGLQVTDLAQALEIIKSYQVIIDAVEGADAVIGEASDLDAVESTQIVAKLFEVIKAIKAA